MVREVTTELLVPEPFPRIELERVGDFRTGDIDEAAGGFVPANVVDVNRARGNARLDAGVAEIEHRLLVLRIILHAGEVDRRANPAPPRLHEAFMEGVELIRVGARFLQPEPLRDGCFDERGRS